MRNADAYSFANTPLKAAHAPLAIARTSHEEDLGFVFAIVTRFGKLAVNPRGEVVVPRGRSSERTRVHLSHPNMA